MKESENECRSERKGRETPSGKQAIKMNYHLKVRTSQGAKEDRERMIL